MSIIPASRPTIREESFWRVVDYFFNGTNEYKELQKLYPVIEIAIRAEKNKIEFYDDEVHVWTARSGKIKSFNWNTDPSKYVLKGASKAVLRTGVHHYKLSYHHIWDNNKRYIALRPDTVGEAVPVFRLDQSTGRWRQSVGQAINQHYGGLSSTWSEGCQTAPKTQYPEFIRHVADGLGYRIASDPLAVVKTVDSSLRNGIKGVLYILLTQEQFDYIRQLNKSMYDTREDLAYQQANFVNIPKIELVRPAVDNVIKNGQDIISAIEIEDAVQQTNQPSGDGSASASVTSPGAAEVSQQPASADNTPAVQPAADTPSVEITQEAPPPSGMLKKAVNWVLALGIIPTTGAGAIETIKSLTSNGDVDYKTIFGVMKEVLLFVLPYVFWIAVIFILLWGLKELLKQVSTIVNNITLARKDMNNVKIVPSTSPRDDNSNG